MPAELTKAQITAARVEQRLAHPEDSEDTAADQLRAQLGLDPDQPIEVVVEDIPAAADETVNELVAQALQNNAEIKQAESQRVASEAHLKRRARRLLADDLGDRSIQHPGEICQLRSIF